MCSHACRDGPRLALVSCMSELDLQDRASLRPTDMCQHHPSVRISFPFPPITARPRQLLYLLMEISKFKMVLNTNHVLHQLLPPEKDTHYNLRQRSHSLPFLQKTTIWSGRIFFMGCYLGIFTIVICIVLLQFIFTISMYMLRTFNPMFHCICMYVVWFASVRPK